MKAPATLMLSLSVLVLFVGGCPPGGGIADPNTTAQNGDNATAELTVGAAGDTVTVRLVGERQATVAIPAGALATDVHVTVKPLDATPAPASDRVLPVARHAVEVNLSGATLSTPAIVTLPMDPDEGARYQCICLYDPASGRWHVPRQHPVSETQIAALTHVGGVLTMVEAPDTRDLATAKLRHGRVRALEPEPGVADRQERLTIQAKVATIDSAGSHALRQAIPLGEVGVPFGFGPGGDDFEIDNFPPGRCWGFSSFATWFYIHHNAVSLHDMYAGRTEVQKLIVTRVHELQTTGLWGPASTFLSWMGSNNSVVINRLTIAQTRVCLILNQRPVPLSLYTYDCIFDMLRIAISTRYDQLKNNSEAIGAHSVLVYYCDNGVIKFYDSNPPHDSSTEYGWLRGIDEIREPHVYKTFVYDPYQPFPQYSDWPEPELRAVYDCYEELPIVSVGDDITITDTDGDGVETIMLPVVSYSAGGNEITSWGWQYRNGDTPGYIAGDGIPPLETPVTLEVGEWEAELRMWDECDFAASDSLQIEVLAASSANGAPIAHDQALVVGSGMALDVTLTGEDPDDGPQALTYSIVNYPSYGRLGGNPPNVTYTPSIGYSGHDEFTFQAHDGQAYSDAATIRITVGEPAQDYPPVAFEQTVTVIYNTPTDILLTANDPTIGPESLTFIIVSQPILGLLSGNPPRVTYSPHDGLCGEDTFTFHVYDGQQYSNVATVSVIVTALPGNQPPLAHDHAVSVRSNTEVYSNRVEVRLAGSDPDDGPGRLDYFVLSEPAHGELSGIPPMLTYIPTAGYVGSDEFTFHVYDGQDYSNAATVSINVYVPQPNQPPVAYDQAIVGAAQHDYGHHTYGGRPGRRALGPRLLELWPQSRVVERRFGATHVHATRRLQRSRFLHIQGF